MADLKKFFKHKSVIIAVLLTIISLVGGASCQQQTEEPHIVFLISKDPNNYDAHNTIPKFAEVLSSEHGFEVSVLLGRGDLNAFQFPNLEILSEADLVIVFCRRIALETGQLNMIKRYLEDGRPLVGIRTANHAFSVRNGEIPVGYEDWWDFVPDVLGCENKGYGPAKLGTDVTVVSEMSGHTILKGIEPAEWHSAGNLYHVAPILDKEAEVLLMGKANDKTDPIAWTRTAGKSRIFYTSLGYPDDFKTPQFRRLLINGIRWALDQDHTQH